MDDYFYYIVGLTVDGLTTLYFSEQYFSAKKLFDVFSVSSSAIHYFHDLLTAQLVRMVLLQKSVEKGINCLEKDEETSQHVVVRGQVKSIGPPIKSLNKSFTSGVIQKLTVKEFFAEKTSFGMWYGAQSEINSFHCFFLLIKNVLLLG